MFVIREPNGEYLNGNYGGTTPNLQKARTFRRRCDAGNVLYKSKQAETVEVVLTLKEEQ